MDHAWQMVRELGPAGIGAVAAGAAGALAAIAALMLSLWRSRWAAPLAAAAAILGAAAALAGGAGAIYLRRTTEVVIADTEANALDAEMIRREGSLLARRAARLGLTAAVPIFLGVAAMIAGRRRRRVRGLIAPAALACAGVLAAGFAAAGARRPIPGRDIPLDAPDWPALKEAAVILGAGEHEEIRGDCRELEERLDDAFVTPLPEVKQAGRRCVEEQAARALLLSPLSRVHDALEAIHASPFAQRDVDLARDVKADLDEVTRMMAEPQPPTRLYPPQIRLGDAAVSGPLPAEVVRRIVRQNFGRFRLCYEDALSRHPDLEGTVSIHFTIGPDGAPRNLGAARSPGFSDAGMVACVVQAFDGISFPEPAGSAVTVTYPVLFSLS